MMVAGSCCNLGHVLGDQGKFEDALTSYGRAVQTLEALQRKEPRHGTTRIFLRNTYQGRARVYLEVRRYRESVADWDKAIEFDPDQHRDAYRCHRAFALAHLGDFAKALAEAEELMKSEKVSGRGVFDLACAYALAAAALEQGTYKPAQADATAERCAGRAVELLREAFRRGYRLVVRLQKDPALAPLRGRADFRKLLAELEQAAKDRER
jgi:tetratricopeptide (TPR) repeat protein